MELTSIKINQLITEVNLTNTFSNRMLVRKSWSEAQYNLKEDLKNMCEDELSGFLGKEISFN